MKITYQNKTNECYLDECSPGTVVKILNCGTYSKPINYALECFYVVGKKSNSGDYVNVWCLSFCDKSEPINGKVWVKKFEAELIVSERVNG